MRFAHMKTKDGTLVVVSVSKDKLYITISPELGMHTGITLDPNAIKWNTMWFIKIIRGFIEVGNIKCDIFDVAKTVLTLAKKQHYDVLLPVMCS